VIALLCGIKISAVYCLVLSQSMCVTDRQTELRLLRPRLYSCSHGKNQWCSGAISYQ